MHADGGGPWPGDGLNGVDRASRRAMPALGFQRRAEGGFVYFDRRVDMLGRLGYRVPEERLPALVAAARRQRERAERWSLMSAAGLAAWCVVGIFLTFGVQAALLPPAGPDDVRALADLNAAQHAVLLSGPVFAALVAGPMALLRGRSAARTLARRHLQGAPVEAGALWIPPGAFARARLLTAAAWASVLLGTGVVAWSVHACVWHVGQEAFVAAYAFGLVGLISVGFAVAGTLALGFLARPRDGWQAPDRWATGTRPRRS